MPLYTPRAEFFGAVVATFLLTVAMTPAAADGQRPSGIAGAWVCDAMCAVWDTSASIATEGENAVCKNELGAIFRGRLLTPRSVGCFGVVGQLSDDGEAIDWSNGGQWRRDHRQAF